MKDYANSLEEISEIRKANRHDRLTKLVMKEYRKFNGKLSWLTQGTRQDLRVTVLTMSRKNNTAKFADLHKVNKVLKKVSSKDSEMYYGMIGKKEELQIVGISVASFKTDEKAVGGIILLLVNRDFTKASPIHWKTKQIERVCHSSKDAETLIINKLVEDAVLSAIR